MQVGSRQIMDALKAVEVVGVGRRDDLKQALFCVFVQKRIQIELFEEAFNLYWAVQEPMPDVMQMLLPTSKVPTKGPKPRVEEALKKPKPSPPRQPKKKETFAEVELLATYSPSEVLRKKDFAAFTAEEVQDAQAFMRTLQWPVEPRKVRRRIPRSKGRLLDVRKTMRQARKHYGEVMHLKKLGPKEKPRPIVLLCDISGSMEPYARMLLQFMHAITGGMDRVESFVFGTRLTRITRYLKHRDVDEAITAVSDHVNDWAGGTRIGEALKDFNFNWLRRVLRSGGVVLIVSDGCDRGDVVGLADEMDRLSRSCRRLIWLNPLLRYAEYEPLTRGMQAAMPYIDDFLPVHNLDALEQIGKVLGRIA